jgi:single-strand DNA-binding protein
MSFARVTLMGRLGKNPEVRNGSDGKEFCGFSLATSYSYKDKQGEKQTDTVWYNITCPQNLATIAKNHLQKGDKVYVEGRLNPRKFNTDKGLDISLDVFASNIQLLPNTRVAEGEDTDFDPEKYEQETMVKKSKAP